MSAGILAAIRGSFRGPGWWRPKLCSPPTGLLGVMLPGQAPAAALSLMRTNLEFYPASADSYVMMAIAETRRLDDPAAIEHLERAVALNPTHSLTLLSAHGPLAPRRVLRRRL